MCPITNFNSLYGILSSVIDEAKKIFKEEIENFLQNKKEKITSKR